MRTIAAWVFGWSCAALAILALTGSQVADFLSQLELPL
ncbi:hypothetical protein VPHK436_0012 [Vibrio phage K436]